MSQPSLEDRRLSFGQAAVEYATYRPSYPRAAVDWLLDGATRRVIDVADVGAGTGALSSVLVDCGLDVTAFEPDPAMMRELAIRVPSAARIETTAENLLVADGTFDALTVAQAFHWFDAAVAAKEFARVVRPGGVIGLLWNHSDDRVAWMAAMRHIVEGEVWRSNDPDEATAELATYFPAIQWAEFAHHVAMTPETIVGLVRTFSFVRLAPDRDQRLDALRELLASHPDTRGRELIDVPYVTSTYRVRRP
jgi:SAM-dependent methyltransferase